MEEQVLAAARARAAALSAQDADGLRSTMHPMCRWTTHAGLVMDREEYVERNTTDVRFGSQRLEHAVVRCVGTCAVITGVVVDELQDGQVFRLLVTMTWVLGEDGWQLLAGHAGPRQ